MNDDWMRDLKADIDSKISEKARVQADAEELEISKRHRVALGYEEILKGFTDRTLATFNQTVLAGERLKIELDYPINIVNAGSFYLTLGALRTTVTHQESSINVSVAVYNKNNNRWIPVGGDEAGMEIGSDGKQLVVRDNRGQFPIRRFSKEFLHRSIRH